MKFICLASSSAGNCYYVEIERVNLPPVKLMLEVGIPFKEIMYKGLNQGIKMSEIDAAVVTHGHGDHCCAVNDFVSHRIHFMQMKMCLVNVVEIQRIGSFTMKCVI